MLLDQYCFKLSPLLYFITYIRKFVEKNCLNTKQITSFATLIAWITIGHQPVVGFFLVFTYFIKQSARILKVLVALPVVQL